MTDPREPTPMLTTISVQIEGTGRVMRVSVPPDITDSELLVLSSWITNPAGLRARLRPEAAIVVPFPRST